MSKAKASRPKAGPAFPKIGETDGAVVEGICRFLRETYPDKTAINVCADTAISPKTVENWLAGVAAPRTIHFVRLFLAYGPEFLCACLGSNAPDWLTEAGRAAARASLDAQIAALEAMRKDVA